MDNYIVDTKGNSNNYNDKIEKMYPEAYKRLKPYVDKAAEMFMGDDQLTEDKVNVMANEILLNSGLAHNPPHGHTRSTLIDIAKALILAQLHVSYEDPYYDYFYPYYYPFWVLPHFGGRRRGHSYGGFHPGIYGHNGGHGRREH